MAASEPVRRMVVGITGCASQGGGPGSGNLNSLQNLYTHGGPHFTTIDRIGYQKTPGNEGGYLDLRPRDNGQGLGVPRDAVAGAGPAQGIATVGAELYGKVKTASLAPAVASMDSAGTPPMVAAAAPPPGRSIAPPMRASALPTDHRRETR